MGYRDAEEMLADYLKFIDCFSEIPNEFNVHPDYLIDGMVSTEFIEGYKAYRELLITIQKDMCSKPEEYGLYKYDKKGVAKPVNLMNYPALWLFVALAQSGEIKDDVLYVDGKSFSDFLNGKAIGSHTAVPRNVQEIVAKLPDVGITVQGYGDGGSCDFTVSSEIPRIMTAIKASTISQYCKKSLMSDYCSFNYRLYTIAADEKIPIEMTRTFLSMPEKSKTIMLALLDELGRNGWKTYKFRHHSINNGWLSFGQVELYYHADGTFSLLIAPWTAHEHHDYLEALPDRYRDIWIGATKTCRGCHKGECRSRFVGEFFGKKGVHCNGAKPHYPLTELEDIPAIIETSLVLSGKKVAS